MNAARWLAGFGVFLFLISGRGAGWCAEVPATAGADAAPQGGREEALPEEAREWLASVKLLIFEEEREAFLKLNREYQRRAFIRRFWQVRDPFPATARNEFKERWEERLQEARQRFDDVEEDRAQALLLYGPPTRIQDLRCTEVLKPLQIWYYASTPEIRANFYLVFFTPGGLTGYRRWSPYEGLDVLRMWPGGLASRQTVLATIANACTRGDDIVTALVEALDWEAVEQNRRLVPNPGDEWVRTFLSRSTDLPEGAQTFPATLDLTFPGRYQSRTLVQGLLSIPRGEVGLSELERHPSYNFLIDGEILIGDELFEHFRYRFNLPAPEVGPERVPLVFQRYLRPNTYTLVLKVEDLNGGRYFREARELEVPRVDGAASLATVPEAAPEEQPTGELGWLAEANRDLASDEYSVQLLVPGAGLKVGKLRVDALTQGEGIARVRFLLNGKAVFAKTRPPFSVELDLGSSPRTHLLRAEALDDAGREMAADEVLINAGPHRFAVRLIEPRRGKRYTRSLRARAVVEVPEGERLERVEMYLNDTLIATLFQPPFIQPMLIPEGQNLSFVRAVAYLEGGAFTEDAVFVNAPDYVDEVRVQLVELYTSVLDRRGRPVEGLEKEDFAVLEDGVEQEIRRFEQVRDVPIYAGILLDTSTSMEVTLPEAVQGALRFFETIITPKDRAAVITFADEPRLAVRFTSSLEVLAGGLAGLTAEGETVLYDSLIYGLHYFSGLSGKRTIILLSDGKDSQSRYGFDDVIEYARRTGVAIYTVALGLTSKDGDTRLQLERLAGETGGRSFFIDSARELERVFATVEEELRFQYLLAYQPSTGEGEGFRSVEVKLARPGLEAKTIRGYFP